jgi:hypothetical protein
MNMVKLVETRLQLTENAPRDESHHSHYSTNSYFQCWSTETTKLSVIFMKCLMAQADTFLKGFNSGFWNNKERPAPWR